MSRITASLFIIFSLLLGPAVALAANILQQKDKRILIEIDPGEDVFAGRKFYLLNKDGKIAALGTVSQIRGKRAILTIEKGNYLTPSKIQWQDSPAPSISADVNNDGEAITEERPSTRGVYRIGATKYSAVLTLSSNTMKTKQTDGSNPVPNTEDVTMKGMGIGFTGVMDRPFNDWLTLRGTLGYEPFNASGSSRFLSCNSLTSTDCNAMINYISGGGYLRFDLTKSRSLFWVAFGGTLKFPLSKKTTALLADDIKTTMTFGAATGLDYFINNKNFIPASLEYQMFQSSDTVSANIILVRAGYGWAF